MPVRKLPIDPYLLAIVGMVALGSLLPARGDAAAVASGASTGAVGLLFFLYGARLSAEAALAGARHWRLHLTVLLATFGLFPVLGELTRWLPPAVLSLPLQTGVMFLCCLPSTVQSSIAFTSIAGGNVPAALCSASASNLLGIVLTPLLVSVLMATRGGGFSAHALLDIMAQLLLPFIAGQLLRSRIGGWLQAHRRVTELVDRGSILLIVYTAFSEGVVNGIWHQLDIMSLVLLAVVNAVLLGLVLAMTTLGSRLLGFARADEIAIVFCGSKKGLAGGLSMASVLFPAHQVGLIVLPLMLFHQLQLMVCATLAKRYASAAQHGVGYA